MKEHLEQNDNYLILKATQGESEAFGMLFDKYSDKIYRFIYYKVINKELAEDVTSQCFLEVREIVILKYIEELSINEIAKIVDKSAGNVRVILHRALKDLQDKIK